MDLAAAQRHPMDEDVTTKSTAQISKPEHCRAVVSLPDAKGRRQVAVMSLPDAMDRRQVAVVSSPGAMDRRQVAVVSSPGAMDRRQVAVVSLPDPMGRGQVAVVSLPDPMGRRQDAVVSGPLRTEDGLCANAHLVRDHPGRSTPPNRRQASASSCIESTSPITA